MNESFRSLVLSAILAIAGPALADNREGAFTVSPFAGGQGNPFSGTSHFDGDLQSGVRAGYNFTQNLGAEMVFGINKTVYDPQVYDCTVYQYGADLLYHFRPQKDFVPFVAAGFGGFTIDFKSKGLSTETSSYFNFGMGADYALTKWMALRLDIRHAITLNNTDHPENVISGTLGLRFQF